MFAAHYPKSYTNPALSLGGMVQPSRINFAQNLARLIANARDESGNPLSQSELARQLSVSSKTISRWVKGEQAPRFDQLDALSRYFSVRVDEFFEDPTVERPAAGITLDRALEMVAKAANLGKPMLIDASLPPKKKKKPPEPAIG